MSLRISHKTYSPKEEELRNSIRSAKKALKDNKSDIALNLTVEGLNRALSCSARIKTVVSLCLLQMQAHMNLDQYASAESVGRLGIVTAKKSTRKSLSIKNNMTCLYTNLLRIYNRYGKTKEAYAVIDEMIKQTSGAKGRLI